MTDCTHTHIDDLYEWRGLALTLTRLSLALKNVELQPKYDSQDCRTPTHLADLISIHTTLPFFSLLVWSY